MDDFNKKRAPTLPCQKCGAEVVCVGKERLDPRSVAQHACPKGQRRRDEPIPLGGIVEATYARLWARTGAWEPTFLEMVRKAYGGVIPAWVKRRGLLFKAQGPQWEEG